MAPWNAETLIEQGPDFVRQFIGRRHDPSEFAPEFGWLLLAELIGFEADFGEDPDPIRRQQWAEIAALLYDGLVRGLRPQDELARESWPKAAAHYRAIATGSAPVVNTTNATTAPEPHPI